MKKEIVVDVGDYEIRIALIENGKLVELHTERHEDERMVGDIYKGRVNAIISGMQAAFVDIGMEKAAFLHSSDIRVTKDAQMRYELDLREKNTVEIIRRQRFESITDILRQGQEVLVQIIKEPISTKGPRVTTDISFPGRFSVLVPDSNYIRVSKKITNQAERKRLRQLVNDVKQNGIGIIVRTEGEGREEKEFKQDIKRLLKIWNTIKKKAEKSAPPVLLHKEESMTSSAIRDLFTADTDQLIVNDKQSYKQILKYVKTIDPQLCDRVELYKSDIPIFDMFNLENEIDKMMDRKVWMKKGMNLVIEQTEAMVTIDVNSGRFIGKSDPEKMILKTNLEAAMESARQIRLRDIGGLIILDFIDMYNKANRLSLYDEFQKCFVNDRAKMAISPVSEFGLIEMTRERTKPSILFTLSELCPTCHGLGRIHSKETMSLKIERWFSRAQAARAGKKFEIILNPQMAEFMQNGETDRIKEIQKANRFKITISTDENMDIGDYKVISLEEDVDITAIYQSAK